MNKTTLNSQKEKHSMLFLRRATSCHLILWRWQFYFYPRSPCGERRAPSATPTASRNFYPRSPCGERLTPARILSRLSLISIHALLAESDRLPTALRTPHQRFLSTLSLRRATAVLQQAQQEADISIHALLAESDLLEQSASYNAALISIHALLAESDACGSR